MENGGEKALKKKKMSAVFSGGFGDYQNTISTTKKILLNMLIFFFHIQ